MTTIADETTLARRRRRWEVLPYWLILPTIAYLAVFFVWPMIQGFGLALRDENGWTFSAVDTMVHDADFATRAEARAAIFEYIEVFYNNQRRHSSLGYVSPAEYEQSRTP